MSPKSSHFIVIGMRTPVYSCYHVYSKVSDKNACQSVDSDLTTAATIQFHDALLLYEICNPAEQLYCWYLPFRKIAILFQFLLFCAILFQFLLFGAILFQFLLFGAILLGAVCRGLLKPYATAKDRTEDPLIYR